MSTVPSSNRLAFVSLLSRTGTYGFTRTTHPLYLLIPLYEIRPYTTP
ncbi:hypothetical protein [Nocardiopsis alkaliphila]|nr:hypothetical protein [Nocardiopsis alkaliphila]